MIEHNSNFSKKDMEVTVCTNGYRVAYVQHAMNHEKVFHTFSEVVNFMAREFGLLKIDEELKLSVKGNEEKQSVEAGP